MIIASESRAHEWLAGLDEGDGAALNRLETLAILLRDENTRQNLVATSSLDHIWSRHIADSAQLLAHVPRETPGQWLDLGTGAGFPGLVIAALRPDLPLVMVESRQRRVEWLNHAVAELKLTNAQVIGSRLELVASFAATVISARAFAPLDKLLKLSARFSTSDTLWLLPKGRSAHDEVNRLTGWSHMFHVEQSLTDSAAGIVTGRLYGQIAAKRAGTR